MMSLFEGKKGLMAFGVGSTQQVQDKGYESNDFQNGLTITEIVNGKRMEKDRIVLFGSFMPQDEFSYGGKQRIVKEYYAGSSDPTIQVMGSTEDDVKIKGVFKEKRLSADLKGAALEYQKLVDAMRIRGNLVEIVLGEWKRYGFIESSNFGLKRLSNISYEINFIIVGHNIPKNYYLVDGFDGDLIKPNKDLTNRALLYMQMQSKVPAEMPVTLVDSINKSISDVAKSISSVTNFVDGILDDADKLKSSAQRAIGVIRNTRLFITKTSKRIASLPNDAKSLSKSGLSEADKLVSAIKNTAFLNSIISLNKDTNAMLRSMQSKMESSVKITPDSFHIVRQGDTLQKISIKYFGTVDKWIEIKDLNKLRSTNLTLGYILKIPK